MLRNPYDPVTPEDKAKAEKLKQEQEKARREAEDLANQCLTDEKFVKYRNRYILLEKLTVDRLIEYNDPDPIQFAFNVRRTIDELRQLRLLITSVERDAKKAKGK